MNNRKYYISQWIANFIFLNNFVEVFGAINQFEFENTIYGIKCS